jgi:hypothetical protein
MIKLYKLITSEEVVGEAIEDGDNLIIKQPCAIMLLASRSTPDQHQMALVPYAGYTKEHSVKLKKSAIVWEAEVAEELYNQYSRIFGSGLEIVPGHLSKAVTDASPISTQVNIT